MTFSPARLVAFDLETYKIAPGYLAPKIVCGSYATSDGQAGLLDSSEKAFIFAKETLESGKILVGANIAFDLGCLASEFPSILPLVFGAFRNDQIYDVQIAQALDAIAGGHLTLDPRRWDHADERYLELRDPSSGRPTKRYSLATCVSLVLGRTDAKKHDAFRTSYGLLEGIPCERWPEEARQYPIDDAVNTLQVAKGQLAGWVRGKQDPYTGSARNLDNLSAQCEAAFALHLGACWGLRADRSKVEELERTIGEAHAGIVERFQKLGWIRDDGTENQLEVKRATALAYGASGNCQRCGGSGVVKAEKKSSTCKGKDGGCDGTGLDLESAPMLPRSDKGGIKCDRDAAMESGNEDLSDYADNVFEKIRSTYIPYLKKGAERPLSFSPNVLVASGRCSYESSPVHQFPRKGGVRESIVARPGRVLCSTDYAAGELCTLAQVCLWTVKTSKMADVINETKDPGSLHTFLAAKMLGMDFDEMRKLVKAKDKKAVDARQAAKAGNFGLPGGMGAPTFVLAKRKKAEGSTTAPDGTVYAGIRFCILLDGAERCNEVQTKSHKDREIPPVCKRCVEVVEELLKPTFFEAYPEVGEYLRYISRKVKGSGVVEQLVWDESAGHHITIRKRGGCGYTDGANTMFQGLLADIGKRAFATMTREGYLGIKDDGSPSPLAGGRFPIFLHDEPIAELLEDTAHLAGPRIAEIMMESGRMFAPDVYWFAEPALSRFLSKDAAPVYKDGKLVVWGDA